MATCKDCFHCGLCNGVFYSQGAEGCSGWADKANTIEVVRCKDCKHRENLLGKFCCPYYEDLPVDDDHFCGYGERRKQ